MSLRAVALLVLVLVPLLSACEQKPAVDPNAPKTPEWEACIGAVESYAGCKIDEAGQIDEGIKGRVTRQMETKKNQSLVSEEKCASVLQGLPADDPCVPAE